MLLKSGEWYCCYAFQPSSVVCLSWTEAWKNRKYFLFFFFSTFSIKFIFKAIPIKFSEVLKLTPYPGNVRFRLFLPPFLQLTIKNFFRFFVRTFESPFVNTLEAFVYTNTQFLILFAFKKI